MVCCALCHFESEFALRVAIEVEGWWRRDVEVEVVEGEEEEGEGED